MTNGHGHSESELNNMTIKQLHEIVQKHNLAQHIHPYKRMRKAELASALAPHKDKGFTNRFKKAGAKPAKPKPSKLKAPSKSKPLIKRTEQLMPGVTQPLYGKGSNLAEAAKAQFMKGYDPNAFGRIAKIVKAEGQAKLGRGKRVKKPTYKVKNNKK